MPDITVYRCPDGSDFPVEWQDPQDAQYSWNLRLNEIQEAAARPTADYSAIVMQRRADRDYWMRTIPLSLIGAGQHVENPYLDRFFGPANEAASTDGVVKGVAASRGVVRGVARVVQTLDEVDRLAPGEILVTMATAPPWTPLFAVAGGVVTEAGGTLSHAAVVAREYRIPAVVGAKGAMRRITDGMLITVDGAAGTVTIEDHGTSDGRQTRGSSDSNGGDIGNPR